MFFPVSVLPDLSDHLSSGSQPLRPPRAGSAVRRDADGSAIFNAPILLRQH